MKRELVEAFIGKNVEVTIFNNEKYRGKLIKGNGYFEEPKWYHLQGVHFSFRCSHVKKIVEIKVDDTFQKWSGGISWTT